MARKSKISIVTGRKEYFKNIGKIKYEGRDSDNPLAFKWYKENQKVGGMRFAVAYWHTFCGDGSDPFGAPTKIFPWSKSSDPIKNAKDKMDAAFEFITKMGIPYYCFHDVDLVAEGDSLLESTKRLEKITDYAAKKQEASGVSLLWGTANLFSNPRGENYVFWGGREGYMSLLNTNMKKELDHMAQFLHMAKDYARKNGFKGTFFIEPKPAEPSKHQYDYDAATVVGFLRQYDLLFSMNCKFRQMQAY